MSPMLVDRYTYATPNGEETANYVIPVDGPRPWIRPTGSWYRSMVFNIPAAPGYVIIRRESGTATIVRPYYDRDAETTKDRITGDDIGAPVF
jgi:hypothetical protein